MKAKYKALDIASLEDKSYAGRRYGKLCMADIVGV